MNQYLFKPSTELLLCLILSLTYNVLAFPALLILNQLADCGDVFAKRVARN